MEMFFFFKYVIWLIQNTDLDAGLVILERNVTKG